MMNRQILSLSAVLAVAAGLLAVRERRTDNPVMPWALFQRTAFTGANLVGFLFLP